MQFGLSEEQVLLQDNVNRFLSDNVPLERVRKYAEDGSDADVHVQGGTMKMSTAAST